MTARFKEGDTAYIVESNAIVREVKIAKFSGDLYLIRFPESNGGIKVRESRLFATKADAEAATRTGKAAGSYKSPWDY